jgi:hypothetical protein
VFKPDPDGTGILLLGSRMSHVAFVLHGTCALRRVTGRRGVLFSCRGVTPSPPPAHSEEHEACDDDPGHEDEMGSGRRLMLLR